MSLLEKPLLKIFNLSCVSIFDQLVFEEYLLRDTDDNYCIINTGSPKAIVLGISGKPDELIYLEEAKQTSTPLIKRFSGGGTVVIDEDTIFTTFIFNSKNVNVPCFPEPIYKFSETIYKEVFSETEFQLRQNDYVFKDKKFGGNAQYIKKDRWLHHTSFLWDYDPKKMALLKHPKKTPEYRQNRSHQDFICTLNQHLDTKEQFSKKLTDVLSLMFNVVEHKFEIELKEPSRISTHFLDI